MRIGELARLGEVSTKAIRYYEQVGVLREPERTSAGYRDYELSAFEQLRFIRAAQKAGLTLSEIREVVAIHDRGEAPCGHVVELLDAKLAEIGERLDSLRRTENELHQLKRRAVRLGPAECCSDTICEILHPGAIQVTP
jgi:DNA-binding transcriptional MerR regulator